MESGINQSNYIEWLKLVQRTYIVAYVCSFVLLSHVLTFDKDSTHDLQELPIFGVSLPRIPAVMFTILIFWCCGFIIIGAYECLDKIKKKLSPEVISALQDYPSIANNSWRFELALFIGLFLVCWLIFIYGVQPKPVLESAITALFMTLIFVFSVLYKFVKKW